MNTKKNTTAPGKGKSSVQKDITRLNEAFEAIMTIDGQLLVAMEKCDNAEVKRLLKLSDEAYSTFAAIKKNLPALKFDNRNGEYFLAKNEDGKENFRVLARVETILEVTAKDKAEAEEKVKNMIKPGFRYVSLEAEAICDNAD